MLMMLWLVPAGTSTPKPAFMAVRTPSRMATPVPPFGLEELIQLMDLLADLFTGF